jgi:hypothetical protein
VAHRVLSILRRRLFPFLTILSLLLCLATVALWVRSYWRCDTLEHVSLEAQWRNRLGIGSIFSELVLFDIRIPLDHPIHQPADYTVASSKVKLGWQHVTYDTSPMDTLESIATLRPSNRSFLFHGFGYITNQAPSAASPHLAIGVPHWFLVLLFAILPLLRLRSILRTRRQNRIGLCQHCGYDLRATPDRCPECGHVPTTAGVR